MAAASVTCSTSGFLQKLPEQRRKSVDGGHGGESTIAFRRGRQPPNLKLRTHSTPATCAVVKAHAAAPPATATAASPGDDSLAAANANEQLQHYYSPLVKMCGITTPEDASLAAQAGAWYVGMIMWPHSKRSVRSLSLAREICAAAREFGAEPVGVFVSESASEIERTCDAAGLTFAQVGRLSQDLNE